MSAGAHGLAPSKDAVEAFSAAVGRALGAHEVLALFRLRSAYLTGSSTALTFFARDPEAFEAEIGAAALRSAGAFAAFAASADATFSAAATAHAGTVSAVLALVADFSAAPGRLTGMRVEFVVNEGLVA